MSTENINLRQQVAESARTNTIVSVEATGCGIEDIKSQIHAMDGVGDVWFDRVNGGWRVTGYYYDDQFTLLVDCNS